MGKVDWVIRIQSHNCDDLYGIVYVKDRNDAITQMDELVKADLAILRNKYPDEKWRSLDFNLTNYPYTDIMNDGGTRDNPDAPERWIRYKIGWTKKRP